MERANPASAATANAAAAGAAENAAQAVDAAVPPLPSGNPDPASSQPAGIVFHITPINLAHQPLVQVRLGNGPDCPIVRPPATLWYGLNGRLQAVAMAEDEEDDEVFDVDVDTEDDDDDDDGDEDGNEASVCDINGHGLGIDDDDDDDDDVVFLGEVVRNSAEA